MSDSKFGFNRDGSTFVIGDAERGVGQIFIDERYQFAKNDFAVGFNRFGNVSEIKNSDYQQSIQHIFGHELQEQH